MKQDCEKITCPMNDFAGKATVGTCTCTCKDVSASRLVAYNDTHALVTKYYRDTSNPEVENILMTILDQIEKLIKKEEVR